MVRGEEWFMIRDLHRKGLSISEIARRTGRDRKTVRKMIKMENLPLYKPREKSASKLDPYKKYIERRMLEDEVENAVKIHREIKKQGYQGGLTILRDFMRPLRRRREKVCERFETPPGKQAQVDWAEVGTISDNGKKSKIYLFTMTLSFSRTLYKEYTIRANTETFMRCHINAFRYFGGVPEEILYDNLKSVVIERIGGVIHFNERFLDFACYYGFSPRACRPYSAKTKGKVERPIHYIKNNFLVGESFADLADLNTRGLIWLDEIANVRIHGTTKEVPFERLEKEREFLRPLREPDYDCSIKEYRRVFSDSTISWKGVRYTVPREFVGTSLLVKEEAGEIKVVFSSEVVARHNLSKSGPVIDKSHYSGLKATLGKRRKVPTISIEVRCAPVVEKRDLKVYAEVAGLESQA